MNKNCLIYPVPNSLKYYIDTVWIIRSSSENLRFYSMPNLFGCIFFNYNDEVSYNSFRDQIIIPKVGVRGGYDIMREYNIINPNLFILVIIKPWVLRYLFKRDVVSFFNKNIDIFSLVNKPSYRILTDQVFISQSVDSIMEQIFNFIFKLIKDNNEVLCGNEIKMINMLLWGNNNNIREITDNLGISVRTFEKIIKQYLGVTPKKMMKMIKFKKSLFSLRMGNTISEVAYDNDYYDKRHYQKVCKEFTGLSPSILREILNVNNNYFDYFNSDKNSKLYNGIQYVIKKPES